MSQGPFGRRFARAVPGLRFFAVTLSLAALAGAPSASAQVLYGSIVGNVQDSTGAALPGATVVIVHDATKLTRQTTADATGSYTLNCSSHRYLHSDRDARRLPDVHAPGRAGHAEHGSGACSKSTLCTRRGRTVTAFTRVISGRWGQR